MSSENVKNLRIFISYAREDTELANRLYNDFKISGLDPWLDTESLLAGQNWRVAIREAIKKSRYFVPLLSSNSVEKIGYVQRELKEAIDVLKEFPQSKIFVIPMRTDECDVKDENLRELHIVDLFPDWKEGIEKALRSMDVDVGKIAKTNQDTSYYHYDNWTELLRYVQEKRCCPFIGSEAHERWIPASRNISLKWAEEHGYPFEDSHNLPQVAQFLAITKEETIYPKNYLSRILKSIKTPDFTLPEYQNTPYAVLASLNLPIYVTTNYDHLMEEALKSRGKEPRVDFCRWNDTLIEYARRASLASVSDDVSYVPSAANPLVFHLHGDMDQPRSMVLTEQDYIDFIYNMSYLDRNPTMIPNVVRKALATSSQLFLGYTLSDNNSRTIFRSITSILATVEPPLAVAVISPVRFDDTMDNARAKSYLDGFARNMFKLNIHWSDLFMFSIRLHNDYDKFRRGSSSFSSSLS